MHIVLIECASIQRHVFGSNMLRENVGGAEQVDRTFPEILRREMNELFTGSACTEWDAGSPLKIENDDSIRAEILFDGGGNAAIVVREIEDAKELIRKVSSSIEAEVPGLLLNVGFAEYGSDQSFQKAIKEAFENASRNKHRGVSRKGLVSLGVTRECATTAGEPASKRVQDPGGGYVWLSRAAATKREEAEKSTKQKEKEYLSFFIDEKNERKAYEDWALPLELDNMGQRIGESHIAVVHIDGNGIGELFQERATSAENLRGFVKQVERRFRQAITNALEKLVRCHVLFDEDKFSLVKVKKERRFYLPFRPIVYGGDDITFVCDGRLGLPLTAEILNFLYAEAHEENDPILSASAGVAMVRTKFPFYRAYELSLELCQNAKAVARKEDAVSRKFWLDFQLIPSGVTGAIERLREWEKGTGPRLYYRPWRIGEIDGACTNRHREWEHFERILRVLRNEATVDSGKGKWSRSRVKRLGTAFAEGKDAVDLVVDEARHRKCPLYENGFLNGVWYQDQSPYYDVIEAFDYFVELEGNDAS